LFLLAIGLNGIGQVSQVASEITALLARELI
jgi:hypothetical protein